MKRLILLIIINGFIGTLDLQSQWEEIWDSIYYDVGYSNLKAGTIYKSKNGYAFPTSGNFRVLNIFVNIIYDLDPSSDPCAGSTSTFWIPTTDNSINQNLPNYLTDFMDVNYSPQNIVGSMTRRFGEASFENLILLGDFVVVNIKQSKITGSTKRNFGYRELMDSTISYINEEGGLSTVFNHNTISDFDTFTPTSPGVEKTIHSNGRIDFIQFITRNTYKNTDLGINYGSANSGSGYGVFAYPRKKIKMGASFYAYDVGNYQCIGDGDIRVSLSVDHEFAHCLFGNNSFHTSGGNHYGDPIINSFMGLQSGFGLMGGSRTSLISCNGYDRWRMDWRSPSNIAYPIAANGVDSDISVPFSGTRTYYLRDFLSYGDAIRIKLPYVGTSEEPNQYLWIENHQVGENNKREWLRYSNLPGSCRPSGTAGIYCYYQIGRDILESSDSTEVFFSSEKDNLKIASAEGNYDIEHIGYEKDCFNWQNRPIIRYLKENPLTGVNDQTEIYINNRGTNVIEPSYDHLDFPIKEKNSILYNKLPSLGDEFDSFQDGDQIKIDTNPASVNVLTHHSVLYKSSSSYIQLNPVDNDRNTRTIYLSGLRIGFEEVSQNESGKIFKVEIGWDDYEINQNVRWCGTIELNESVIIKSNNSVNLEQGLSTVKANNPVIFNGDYVFADATVLQCNDNSYFEINDNAELKISENSSFILSSGSELKLKNGGLINVDTGGTFSTQEGSFISIDGINWIHSTTGTTDICNATIIGNGYLNGTALFLSFENQSLSGMGIYNAWNTITCDNVTINSNANITLSAKDLTVINGPFSMNTNSVLNIIPECPENQ